MLRLRPEHKRKHIMRTPLPTKSLFLVMIALLLFNYKAAGFNNVLTVTNIAELRSLNIGVLKTNGYTDITVIARGYYTPGDRGGGTFWWDSSSTNSPDGGRWVHTNGWTSGAGRWVRQLNGETPNVKMWGAKGDWTQWYDYPGTLAHDDTTNIQNALNAFNVGLVSGANSDVFWAAELLFPPGWYKVTDTLIWPAWRTKLRGESCALVYLRMPIGIQKDILRAYRANEILNGGSPADPSDVSVRIEDISLEYQGALTNHVANTNSCLVVSLPQEGSSIRNLQTFGGGYGIRCFGGGNGTPFALRDIVTWYAKIAGVNIEPLPGVNYAIGHVAISGITGDYFVEETNTASLVRFWNFVGMATVDDINAEGSYGGGVVQHKFPDLTQNNSTWWDPSGLITIRGSQFNGSYGFYSNDLVVLKGGKRTTSLSVHAAAMYAGGSLVRDEVTGRKVPADVVIYSGLSQTAARLPVNYESYNDGATNYALGKRSRLVVGDTAVYSFVPTNTGWYRIMAPWSAGFISGKLTVRSVFSAGAEFEVNVNPRAGTSDAAWINVLRSSKDNANLPPLVTKARAFYYWESAFNDWWAGVDVYVANVISVANNEAEKRVIFSLPLDGFEGLESGIQQLLAPTSPVSTGSGDTNGLPSGAVYSVANLVR